jgi:hypothetical protein
MIPKIKGDGPLNDDVNGLVSKKIIWAESPPNLTLNHHNINHN